MQFYFFLFLIIMLPLVLLIIRSFVMRRRKISSRLFFEGLKNENSGEYEAAVITYESALDEIKKTRFPGSDLKNKIVERIKTLHTVIEYKKNSDFRQAM